MMTTKRGELRAMERHECAGNLIRPCWIRSTTYSDDGDGDGGWKMSSATADTDEARGNEQATSPTGKPPRPVPAGGRFVALAIAVQIADALNHHECGVRRRRAPRYNLSCLLAKCYSCWTTRRSTTFVTPLVSRANASARLCSAADLTLPMSVTVDPVVETSIASAFTESSSAILALIFEVVAVSSTVSLTFVAATCALAGTPAAFSPISAPRSRAFSVSASRTSRSGVTKHGSIDLVACPVTEEHKSSGEHQDQHENHANCCAHRSPRFASLQGAYRPTNRRGFADKERQLINGTGVVLARRAIGVLTLRPDASRLRSRRSV